MSKSRAGIVLALLATVIVSLGSAYTIIAKSPDDINASSTKRVELIVSCIKSTADKTTTATISDAEVETCLSTAAGQPETVDETIQMLEKITTLAQSDIHIRGYCHDILHELGRAAWKVGELDVFTIGHGACGFGYYHGAMFDAITEKVDKNIVLGLNKFCQGYAASSSTSSQTEWYLCLHGIGHAIASISESLTEAEEGCREIGTVDQSAFIVCFSGVLNEKFIREDTTTQEPKDAVKICTMKDESAQGVCYRFALNYSGSDSSNIADFCLTLEDSAKQRGCWAGVGMRIGSKELFANPDSPGYTIAKTPEATAEIINDACAKNKSIHCDTALLNELSQRILDYDLIQSVCNLMSTEPRKNNCISIADQQRPLLLKS